MVKKLPKGEKNIFFLFLIYFTFSFSAYGKKENHLLFPQFLSPEIGKPQGRTSHKKIFFLLFFRLFCTLPLLVIGKITNSLFFFPKLRLKVLENPAKRAQVSFFYKLPFFRRDHANTHTPTHTHSVFRHHNVEKTPLTPFS